MPSSATHDLRTRRIDNEWRFLVALTEENPALLNTPQWQGDDFLIELTGTPALISDSKGVKLCTTHKARFEFSRYYPAVPIEAYLTQSVLHPNAHPTNGFVCLWDQRAAGDAIIEAVGQLRRVISWQLVNNSSDHLMQPEIARQLVSEGWFSHLPLKSQDIVKPAAWLERNKPRQSGYRHRLSPVIEGN